MTRTLPMILLLAVAATALNVYQAAETVVERLLDGDPTGVRVYVDPVIREGGVIELWHESLRLPEERGVFVFIDDVPGANWEHAARCVFITEDGGITVWPVTTPPRDETALRLIEVTDPSPWSRFEGAYIYHPLPEGLPRRARVESSDGAGYALLLSGGVSQSTNYPRYWNDISYIYTTLYEVYGYEKERIIVLMSNGDDPAPDRSDGSSSPLDLNNDGENDYHLACTYDNVVAQLEWLSANLTPEDTLFIFTTDHGGRLGGELSYLNLWDYERLYADEFADLLAAILFSQSIITMGQCFSGGFIEHVDGLANVVISTACGADEYSWPLPSGDYNEFLYHWTAAVAGNEPGAAPWRLDGSPTDADDNGDGVVSALEAFTYAEAHDTADETPGYGDYSGIGARISLHGWINLVITGHEVLSDGFGVPPGGGAEIHITVQNLGEGPATGVTARLTSADPEIIVLEDTIEFGELAPGEVAASPYPFLISVSTGADNPGLYLPECVLSSTEYNDAFRALLVKVGEFTEDFHDDVEGGNVGWRAELDWMSQWHITDYRARSPEHSWKCGGRDGAPYAHDARDALLSPLLIINPDDPRLTFRGWRDLRSGDYLHLQWGNEYEGWTEIASFTGSATDWTRYSFELGERAGDIGRLRFELVTDSAGNAEGFYFDDLSLGTPRVDYGLLAFDAVGGEGGVLLSWELDDTGEVTGYDLYRETVGDVATTASVPLNEYLISPRNTRWLDRLVEHDTTYLYSLAVHDSAGGRSLFGPVEARFDAFLGMVPRLFPPYPSPTRDVLTVEFETVRSGRATLGVYDLAGRLVARLLDERLAPGRHSLTWEVAVPPGVYLLRLDTPGGAPTRRVVVEG